MTLNWSLENLLFSPYVPQPPREQDTPILRWLIEVWKKLGRKGAILGALKFGTDTSSSEFEDDGMFVARRTWNDINFSAGNLKPGVTVPTWGAILASGGMFGYLFSATKVESLHGSGEVLHNYKEGTVISPHVHWAPSTTNTGVARWGLEYTWANAMTVIPAPTTIYAEQAGGGTAWHHQLLAFPDIVGTGKTIGSMFIFRIFRDGTHINDTYTGDAYLAQIGIHYEIDTLGSRTVYTK